MLATLTRPGASLLDLSSDTLDKLRQCPRVLLYGHSHNYHKVVFVTAAYEIFPIPLKDAPDQPTAFLPADFTYVMRSAEGVTCNLVTRRQARHLLRDCSYYRTTHPDPEVFRAVLGWLA